MKRLEAALKKTASTLRRPDHKRRLKNNKAMIKKTTTILKLCLLIFASCSNEEIAIKDNSNLCDKQWVSTQKGNSLYDWEFLDERTRAHNTLNDFSSGVFYSPITKKKDHPWNKASSYLETPMLNNSVTQISISNFIINSGTQAQFWFGVTPYSPEITTVDKNNSQGGVYVINVNNAQYQLGFLEKGENPTPWFNIPLDSLRWYNGGIGNIEVRGFTLKIEKEKNKITFSTKDKN